jgi:hypothetical protein
VSDKKVYVTRFDKNLASTDPTIAGDDIAILDRDTGEITGHIDLAGYGSEVDARRSRRAPIAWCWSTARST